MSKSALARNVIPRTYAELRHGVEETLLAGQRRIEEAKVRTYWETGRLIHEHLLRYEDRAAGKGYGRRQSRETICGNVGGASDSRHDHDDQAR